VNRRVTRWFAELQDYWFEIKHVPGKTHTATDFLSRPFIDDKGEQDNEDVVVLPPELFVKTAIQVFDIDSIFGELDEAITNTQDQYLPMMKDWQKSTTQPQPACHAHPTVKFQDGESKVD